MLSVESDFQWAPCIDVRCFNISRAHCTHKFAIIITIIIIIIIIIIKNIKTKMEVK